MEERHRLSWPIVTRILLAVLFLSATSVALNAQSSLSSSLLPGEAIPQVSVPPIDAFAEARAAASERSIENEPPRFAIPFNTSSYDAMVDGVWEASASGWSIWRLRLQAPGAIHVNLGFSKYVMPVGGSLHLSGIDGLPVVVYTEADNKPHQQLWTPIVRGSTVTLEVNLPPGTIKTQLTLLLTSINSGFRSFLASPSEKSGSCNVDVACPEGDEWRDEISSVGVFGQGGSFFCTGTLINNAMNDRTPYFLTARHCGIDSESEAQSVVVYWNFETSSCGGARNGPLNQFQSGASIVASHFATDFTLLLLDSRPNDEWNIHYSGWDRSGSPLNSAVAIHHPSGDEKSLSFENDAPFFVSGLFSFLQEDNGPSIYIGGWDKGTTEFGSSGSALFDSNHRIVGQLLGGASSCDLKLPDWYGSLVGSWIGGGSPSTRLRDWLDPNGGSVMTVDTIGPTSSVPSPTGDTPELPAIPVEECFSGTNTVEVDGVGMVLMADLRLGDYVRTCAGNFSPVYSFFHKQADHVTRYIKITSENGDQPLEVSQNHIIFANGKTIRAADVQVGDRIPETVLSVERDIYSRGLFAPVTRAGTLVVSGVCVSSYVALWTYDPAWLQNWVEHSAMGVARMVCGQVCPWETYDDATGFAMQYKALIHLISWIEATGGDGASLGLTLTASPFLLLVSSLEIAVASWATLGTIGTSFYYLIHYSNSSKRRGRL